MSAAAAARLEGAHQPRLAVGAAQQAHIDLENARAALRTKTSEAETSAEQVAALRATVSTMQVELAESRMTKREQSGVSANARQLRQDLDESQARVRELERALEREKEEVADLRAAAAEEGADFETMMAEAQSVEEAKRATALECRRLEDELKARDEAALATGFRIAALERKLEELAPPESLDACLSPRSYSDDVLISSRDDLIAAKEQQIELVTKANWKLMGDVNKLEDELERVLGEVASAVDLAKAESKRADQALRVRPHHNEAARARGGDRDVDEAERSAAAAPAAGGAEGRCARGGARRGARAAA